jgi:hypothetical protein
MPSDRPVQSRSVVLCDLCGCVLEGLKSSHKDVSQFEEAIATFVVFIEAP